MVVKLNPPVGGFLIGSDIAVKLTLKIKVINFLYCITIKDNLTSF